MFVYFRLTEIDAFPVLVSYSSESAPLHIADHAFVFHKKLLVVHIILSAILLQKIDDGVLIELNLANVLHCSIIHEFPFS